jgi:integrase
MASLTQAKKTGAWRILFFDDRGRQTVHLGKMDEATARTIFGHVDHLCTAATTGTPPHRSTTVWLSQLGGKMHGRIAAAGLVEPREPESLATVGELVERFVDAANVSEVTLDAYRQTTRNLVEFFGADAEIAVLTPEDAALWCRSLADGGYARATQSKRTKVAKRIFQQAVEWGLLDASPFASIRPGTQRNPERTEYIPVEHIERVIDQCPDASWRARIGLCRYAALRCPSELHALTWADVDLVNRRLTVRPAKTRNHETGQIRLVPITPRLAELLEDLYELAEPGDDQIFPDMTSQTNLGPPMAKMVVRAGLKPWPRLMQNLRASCAIDWHSEYPEKDASSWVGHSPLVASLHYLKPRDENFRKATGLPSAQIPTQQATTDNHRRPHQKPTEPPSCGHRGPLTAARGWDVSVEVGPEGLEPPLESPSETAGFGPCAQIPTRAVSPVIQTALAWAAAPHPWGR